MSKMVRSLERTRQSGRTGRASCRLCGPHVEVSMRRRPRHVRLAHGHTQPAHHAVECCSHLLVLSRCTQLRRAPCSALLHALLGLISRYLAIEIAARANKDQPDAG
jgi:hypothetical protein